MEQLRFRKWQVYTDSQNLFSDMSKIISSLPGQFKGSLGDQISRSSLSIVLNIAEGSGKNSIKELSRFLDIALGSAYETLACTDSLLRNKLINKGEYDDIEVKIMSIYSQLGGFKKKLRTSK